MFSKGLFCRVVKTLDCAVKILRQTFRFDFIESSREKLRNIITVSRAEYFNMADCLGHDHILSFQLFYLFSPFLLLIATLPEINNSFVPTSNFSFLVNLSLGESIFFKIVDVECIEEC